MRSRAYVGIGSNLGDGPAQVATAVAHMAALPGTRVLRTSSLYETEPWGESPNWYVNAVAELETTLASEDLLERLLAIETTMGRRRIAGERWAPRPIDLDLLLHDSLVLERPTLTLPHPRLHERRFVLEPLAELAPDAMHPRLGQRIAALLAGVDDDKVVRRVAPPVPTGGA